MSSIPALNSTTIRMPLDSPNKNGAIGTSTASGGGNNDLSKFRRAQSLRFPRSTAGFNSSCQSPSVSSPAIAIARIGSRNFRSKSSRHRFGSIEAQSLLGRLSASQRIALVSTWRQMRNQLCPLMRKILIELEQTEPVVKEIFYKAGLVDCWEKASGGAANPATMDEHVRLMAKFFDDLVLSVESAGPCGVEGGEEISANIREMGQRHAILAHSSGLPADVWEKLGEIAMEKFSGIECVQRTRDAGRAWRTLIAFLTDKIRCGFEEEAKTFSRRPSSELYQQTMDGRICEELSKKLQQLSATTESDSAGSARGNGLIALGEIDDPGCSS